MLSVLSVAAYDFEIDGLCYTILPTTEMTCKLTRGENKYSGDITIPASVSYKNREFSVVRIDLEAFKDCTGLTSVKIPNSVTEIMSGAFQGCSGLTAIDIPNSVIDIEDQTFEGCSGLTSVRFLIQCI